MFQIITNLRKGHDAIFYFAKEMFPILRANGNEIGSAIVLVPPSTGGWNTITTFVFCFVHKIHNWFYPTNVGIISIHDVIMKRLICRDALHASRITPFLPYRDAFNASLQQRVNQFIIPRPKDKQFLAEGEPQFLIIRPQTRFVFVDKKGNSLKTLV